MTFRELGFDEVETFYRLYEASASRQGFEPVPLPVVRDQLALLGPSGGTRIFAVEFEGEALGSLLVTCFGDTVMWKLPGIAPDRR